MNAKVKSKPKRLKTMDIGAVEASSGVFLVLLGWLHLRINTMTKRIDSKASKDDLNNLKHDTKDDINELKQSTKELKSEVTMSFKEIIEKLTHMQVDSAKLHVIMEKFNDKN